LNPMVSSSKDGGGVLGGVVGGGGVMVFGLVGRSSKRTCRLLLRFLGLTFDEDEDLRIEGGLVTRPLWT
jgi:hypothetical protein